MQALCFLVVIALQLCIAQKIDVERILTMKNITLDESKKQNKKQQTFR